MESPTQCDTIHFACWVFFHAFVLVCCLFKKNLSGIPSVSNSLDPDQARHFVEPDLGPNCCKGHQLMTLVGKEINLSCPLYILGEHWLEFPNFNAFLVLKIVLTLCCLLTTLQTVLTQIRHKKYPAWSGSKLFHTLMIVLKEFLIFEVVWKKSADDKKACKITQHANSKAKSTAQNPMRWGRYWRSVYQFEDSQSRKG